MMFFLYFPDGNWPPCWIFKSMKFYMLTRLGGTRHITMPIFFSKLAYPKQIYCNFSIFQMTAAAIFLFLKSPNFLANGVQRIKTHDHVKFWQNRSKGTNILRFFYFSKWRMLPSWIFKFVKFHWQTSVWKAQTHHSAKCHPNRSSCCGDIAIFRIFIMAAAAILDFLK